ncbi:MAG: ABC-F type ribosomal protection protein [Oscillospiraceae bacterium]|nr:ABC-F type ribosomal protection protein [Oscillospiraceae bacterium]
MSLISVQDLTFGYDGSAELLFEHASFQLDTDWCLGFVGRNGRGKTTFLRLLLGEYEYRGSIRASVDFDYFPFAVPDLSLTANQIASKVCPELEHWRLLQELAQLELNETVLNRPFATLSNGERTKLLLSALFLRENRFLLIDEPTNHLDLHGREVLSRYLHTKKGFILVSHDRAFLDGCIDHVLSINRATIEVQKGNCSTWLDTRHQQDEFELAQNAKLKKEISRLEQTAKEKAGWADKSEREKIGFDPTKTEKSMGRRPYLAAKSKKANKRAKAISGRQEAALEEKSKLLKNIEKADSLRLPSLNYRSEVLCELRDVTVDYGDGPVFRPVSFRILRGDRLNLVGYNGAGKSSLLRLLAGESVPYSGEVRVSGGVVISWLPQDTSSLAGSLTEYAERESLNYTMFLTFLRKLDFQRSQFDKPMEQFSMGQKKKVLLAKSLCEPAHLYLWDEPLNYIDLLSRGQIEELLMESDASIMFVEHDRFFCDRIATGSVKLQK